MRRYQYTLFILAVVFIAAIISPDIAVSKKTSVSLNRDQKTLKDVKMYADHQKIDLDTAAYRLALQDLAGNLDAALTKNVSDSYAGLWIQHSPQFRIIVQFTKDEKDRIESYIFESGLADTVDIRIVKYSLC